MTILKFFFSFEGKINRLQFLSGTIISRALIISGLLLTFSDSLIFNRFTQYITFQTQHILGLLLIIVGLFLALTLGAKRLRDTGINPYSIFLIFVPIASFVIGVLCFFAAGKKSINQVTLTPD